MLYRLNQLILHNFEGKYILMRLCVSDWMGRKSSKIFIKIFFEPTVLLSAQTGYDRNFVAARELIFNYF